MEKVSPLLSEEDLWNCDSNLQFFIQNKNNKTTVNTTMECLSFV